MEFLHEFKKIDANQPNETHMFAMHKSVGNSHWAPRLQSTLYFADLWQPNIDLRTFPAGVARADFSNVWTLEACLEQCMANAMEEKKALRTVRYTGVWERSCFCFGESLLEWRFDSTAEAGNMLWEVIETHTRLYEVRACEFTRPDTHGRTMVWSKNAELPAHDHGWCTGSPAGLGKLSASRTIETPRRCLRLTFHRLCSQVRN
tara:strand:+ start:279 stop:890 length:612 start_codon:yes stop_codon:yes gene_type:complete